MGQIIPPGYQQTVPNGAFVADASQEERLIFGLQKIAEPPNSAPQFTTLPPTETILVGDSFTYRINAEDPDLDRLVYDITLSPEGMAIDPETGVLIWTPQPDQEGIHNVLVRVQDGRGGFDLQYFQVEVEPPNRAPLFTSSLNADVTPQVGKIFYYQATALDADGDTLTYNIIEGDAEIDLTSGLLQWTPTIAGEEKIVIEVDDGRGGVTTQTLNLTATLPQPNTPPEITSLPSTTLRLGNTYFYDVIAKDIDGDNLTYSLSTESPSGMEIDEQGRIIWTPQAQDFGSQDVEVLVHDGEETTRQQWDIFVSDRATNNPPAIVSIPSLVTDIEKIYEYRPSATDPDGDKLLWDLESAPLGMSIDPETGVLVWQPQMWDIGEQTITVRVTDGNTYAIQEYPLTVRGGNTPPQIVSVPITQGTTGENYTYQVVATDIDGDTLTYIPVTKPEGMTIDPETGVMAWTPDVAGTYEIEILVKDERGGIQTQKFKVEIGTQALNHAPEITSLPIYTTDSNGTYSYPIIATDPDGDNLSYQKISGPDGMSLNGNILTWENPTIGEHQVVIGVEDSQTGAAQGFTLTVYDNQAPNILENAPLSATPETPYRYDIRATDPEGGTLTYQLSDEPDGMEIDPETGRIEWTPELNDAGQSYLITVEVEDEAEATTEYTYTITVGIDTEAPKVKIKPLGTVYTVVNNSETEYQIEKTEQEEISFQTLATDNEEVKSLQVFINDIPVIADGNGVVTATVGEVGSTIAVKAIATDKAGNQKEGSFEVKVVDTLTPAQLSVDLDLSDIEEEGEREITNIVEIKGTVENLDGGEVEYCLEAIPIAGGEAIAVFEGTGPIQNGILGTFDPTLLPNDSYNLRLTAKGNGQRISTEKRVDVVGELKLGNFQLSFTDLEIPLSGIPITVTRTYDSLYANEQENFGYGWRLEFRDTNLKTSVPAPSAEQELLGEYNAFREGDKVFIALPGGKRESFTFSPKIHPEVQEALNMGAPWPESALFYVPAFISEDGSELTLSVKNASLLKNDKGEYYSPNSLNYNPAHYLFGGQYTLTTQEGIEYVIHAESGDLLTATDTNGNTLTFSDAGITSDTGVSVTFERDAEGRIKKVIDPRNYEVIYNYDETGNLVEVIDQEQNKIEYKYDYPEYPHYLTEVIDPLETRPVVRSTYLSDGRLQKVFDIDNDPITFEYDPDSNTQIIKDANGIPTLYEYDNRGNVIRQANQVNGVTHETRFKYEGDDLIEITDPNGNIVTYDYDSNGNLTSRTELHDPNNPDPTTTYYNYNRFGQTTAITLPTGATFKMDYDSRGNLLAMKDGNGNIIQSYVYDAYGRVIEESDPFGTTYYNNFDAFGNPRWMQDAAGEITTSTYNPNGQIQTMTENPGTPEEEISTFTYDGLGREDYTDYGDGVWVDYDYEGAGGDWTKLEAPTIGTIERKFNDDGSLGGWITPGNEELTFEYNKTGQLEKEITPHGITTYGYDSLGRVKSVIDETTGIETITHYDTHYEINAYQDPDELADNLIGRVAAREIALHDADDTRYITHYTYYPDGQIKTMTDARGETWHYRYSDTTVTITDPLGRETTTVQTEEYLPSETRYADGTSSTVDYLFDNNLLEGTDYPTEITDRAGRDRDFTYDELGRLESATDWGNTTYTYHYDENGFDYSVSNPNGETVLGYNYGENGDLETVTYLDEGQRSFVYDPITNALMQETLPSGEVIDYEYDADSGLETRRVYSLNGDTLYEVVTDWNFETGQLLSVTDPTGITTYHYDPNTGAFAGLDYPNNSSIRYQRDELGRVEKVTVKPDKDGATEYVTEYEYDANGNIEKVTDPTNSQATVMIYDEVNRLEERTLPNGIKTAYTYKENTDFIEKIVHYAPDGVTVMSSVEYIRSDSGEPTKITREDGSYVELKYDESLRLEKETYYDANGVQEEEIAYSYDAEGNRQTVSSGEAQGNYDYENIHQLTQIDTGEGLETYHYDDGGRLETITRDGETWEFLYNADDLIIEVKKGENIVVQYAYDSAGRRVEMTDGAGEKDYVVAPLMGEGLESPHLVMDGENDPLAAYVYAGAMPLMRLDDQGNPTYYLEDGMGSIVGLADNAGVEVAEFEYDSFGNLRNGATGMPNELGGDFRFQGQWLESNTDFYHFRARYYDPETGRFVSRDPIDLIPTEPESSNPYQFVYNNPHIYSDPSGMITLHEMNTRHVLDQIINTLKTEIKNTAIDKAKGIVGEVFNHFLGLILPSDLQFVDDVFNKIVPIPKGKANAGDLAEDLIVDTALTVLNIAFPQFTNFVWREPEIAYDGEPLYNGKNYGQPLDAPNVFQSGQRGTKPDYVISKYKPVDEVKGSLTQKSYLIGDFKITPKAALDYVKGQSNRATKPKNQWLSMRGYAKKHQYTPLTNFITFYDNPTQIRLTKKIALKRDKVILFVIPLTYKQTK